MCCVKWCRNDSLLETTCLQENLGKSVIYIFIENLLLILGTVQIKFVVCFFFLISYWLPSPMTLPGVYPLICICCTKRVSSFGGVWAQLDEYIYADFLSIFPSSQVSLIY